MPSLARPRLLALMGSPRQQGASQQLIQAFLRGTQGWKLIPASIAQRSLLPCRACEYCKIHGVCLQPDKNMQKLISEFDRADALVLSAPVYFYGFPAQVKAMIDRCQPLWHDVRWRQRKKRPAFFISSCDTNTLREFEVIIREAKAFFNTIGFQSRGNLFIPGLGAKNRSQRLAHARLRAKKAGKTFSRQYHG